MARSIPSLIVLILLAVACQPPAESGRQTDTAADEAALRELVEVFDRAVREEDVEAMMALNFENSIRMDPNVPAAIGFAAVRELFLQGWEENDFDVTNELVDVRVVGDIATGWGTYTIRVTPADGSEPFDDVGKWAATYQRQTDGSWTTLWDIWNSDLPARPTPAMAAALPDLPLPYYQVLFEDNAVRIVDHKLGPGESEPEHTHAPMLAYFVSGATLDVTEADGSTQEMTIPTGAFFGADNLVWWTHSLENTGDTPLHTIIVELKGHPRDGGGS